MSGIPSARALARMGRAIAVLQYVDRRIARGDGPIFGIGPVGYQRRSASKTPVSG